jgi:hypothetical protein
MATPAEKITPYDEFNFEIPEDEFPKSGISARAAEALVPAQAGPASYASARMWRRPPATLASRRRDGGFGLHHSHRPQRFCSTLERRPAAPSGGCLRHGLVSRRIRCSRE